MLDFTLVIYNSFGMYVFPVDDEVVLIVDCACGMGDWCDSGGINSVGWSPGSPAPPYLSTGDIILG